MEFMITKKGRLVNEVHHIFQVALVTWDWRTGHLLRLFVQIWAPNLSLV